MGSSTFGVQEECLSARTPAVAQLQSFHDKIPIRHKIDIPEEPSLSPRGIVPVPVVCFDPSCDDTSLVPSTANGPGSQPFDAVIPAGSDEPPNDPVMDVEAPASGMDETRGHLDDNPSLVTIAPGTPATSGAGGTWHIAFRWTFSGFVAVFWILA